MGEGGREGGREDGDLLDTLYEGICVYGLCKCMQT